MGILYGDSDGAFRPNASITRAELAAIAARFARLQNAAHVRDMSFPDINGHWAEQDVVSAAGAGWIDGYPDGRFRSEAYITRAEFMALVNRMTGRAPEHHGVIDHEWILVWPDNLPDKWYYLDVQEASNSHDYERKGTPVPGRDFYYERWTDCLPPPDWRKLDQR